MNRTQSLALLNRPQDLSLSFVFQFYFISLKFEIILHDQKKRRNASSFGHADPDPSSVNWISD
jgi:hypothetical protein